MNNEKHTEGKYTSEIDDSNKLSSIYRPAESYDPSNIKRYTSQVKRFSSHKDNATDQPNSPEDLVTSEIDRPGNSS